MQNINTISNTRLDENLDETYKLHNSNQYTKCNSQYTKVNESS